MPQVQQIYVGLLALVCLAALVHELADLKRGWRLMLAASPIRRTAFVLLANWTVNTAFVIASGIHDPWAWFVAVDALSAAIVLHQPAGKPQSVVGGLYMAQIVMHGVYGTLKLSGDPIAESNYWQLLTALAFLQIVVLGGWTIGHHWRRLARHPGLRRRASVAGPKSGEGVAE